MVKLEAFSRKHFNEDRSDRVIAFIESGEPTGLNFETLMNYISNLTINGLLISSSVYVLENRGWCGYFIGGDYIPSSIDIYAFYDFKLCA